MNAEEKKALRAQIRVRKRAMTIEEIEERSAKLVEKFLASDAYKNAKTVYGYLPYNQEVRTTKAMEQVLRDGKSLALPKIYGDRMDFIVVTDLSQVEKGYCGIPEPIHDAPLGSDETSLVLMPGMAFDREGHRMGYGGGFYDKFLEREPNHPTIALCYEFQLLDHLDVEAHDIPVDEVIWA